MSTRAMVAVLGSVLMICLTVLAVARMLDDDDGPRGTGIDPCLRVESC